MVTIKGPKSALSNFIEEHGINIKNLKKENNVEIQKEPPKRTKKDVKKGVKHYKSFEMSNIEKQFPSLEDISLNKIYKNEEAFEMDDVKLELYSSYLSRNRYMNSDRFNFLVKKSINSLIIHDCSMIKNEDYKIFKNLNRLELHFAGQLQTETLNHILKDMNNLEILKITGAYLLDDIILPRSLRVIDVSHCSRIEDKFIQRINKTFKVLDELRLSYCYYLSDQSKLKINVKKLYVCETRISNHFFEDLNFSYIVELSLKRCSKIFITEDEVLLNRIQKMEKIELLDLEGISTINAMKINSNLKHMNVSFCYGLVNIVTFFEDDCKIENLNVSRINISKEDLLKICNFKNLKVLNVSWCKNLDDDVVYQYLNKLSFLEKIFVFGCFKLSTNVAKKAWEIRSTVQVIGNPAETTFLLDRNF